MNQAARNQSVATCEGAGRAVTLREYCPWKARVQVSKWTPDQVYWARRRSGLLAPSGAQLRALVAPEEVITREHNLLVNAGIQRLLDLLIGAGGQAYTNSYARLGTGNGAGTAAAGDTDLSASSGSTNRWFQAMDATFPSRSSQTLTFKSTFGTGDGNFAWNEWGIDQGGAGSSTSGNTVGAPLLNHKTGAALGTKSNGTIWTLTATITPS